MSYTIISWWQQWLNTLKIPMDNITSEPNYITKIVHLDVTYQNGTQCSVGKQSFV